MITDRTKFNHETTTDQVLEGIDLTGKQVLITGGSSGLGAETARAMASKGAKIVVTARNLEKAAKVIDEIKASTGNSNIEAEKLELDSFASIRAFAKRFLEKYDKLDILINNAGVMACPHGKTRDGFEMQFGTNHLGHFLLTGLIAPALIKGAPSRIVNLSSGGHRVSPVLFNDINFEKTDYDKWVSYGQSKTANALHAVELNRRLRGKGVEAYSVHPGAIMTDLGRHMEREDLDMMNESVPGGSLPTKTVEQGAATQVYAATAPELEGKGGAYLADCQIMTVNDESTELHSLCSFAVDPEAAQKLWTVSEEFVGLQFSF